LGEGDTLQAIFMPEVECVGVEGEVGAGNVNGEGALQSAVCNTEEVNNNSGSSRKQARLE
jgi:hypothetical protein